MIVKFFKKPAGGSAMHSANYLIGENLDRPDARILRGDPFESALIADSLTFKNSYTVGCLSFEEANISEELKEKLMDDFERALFANLERERYNISWVEHLDKGRLELNFLLPKVDLLTGRSITPYLTGRDTARINAFKNIANIENNFSDPDDPTKIQLTKIAEGLPLSKKETVEKINTAIEEKAINGTLKNRDEVLNFLTENGFSITRKTNKAISIADPKGGQNIRLKGEIYEDNFSGYSPFERQEKKKKFDAQKEERLKKSREDFERLTEQKQKEYAKYLDERAQANPAPTPKIILSPKNSKDPKPQKPYKSKELEGLHNELSPIIARVSDLLREHDHKINRREPSPEDSAEYISARERHNRASKQYNQSTEQYDKAARAAAKDQRRLNHEIEPAHSQSGLHKKQLLECYATAGECEAKLPEFGRKVEMIEQERQQRKVERESPAPSHSYGMGM